MSILDTDTERVTNDIAEIISRYKQKVKNAATGVYDYVVSEINNHPCGPDETFAIFIMVKHITKYNSYGNIVSNSHGFSFVCMVDEHDCGSFDNFLEKLYSLCKKEAGDYMTQANIKDTLDYILDINMSFYNRMNFKPEQIQENVDKLG